MNEEQAEVLAEFSKRKQKADRLKKRSEALKHTFHYYVSMADDFIRANPVLSWEAMQTFQPPKGALEDWQVFVEVGDEHLVKAFRAAGNARITGYPTMPMKGMLTEHIGKLVSIEGKIIAISDIEPLPVVARFRCMECGEMTESKSGKQPWKCEAKDCGKRNCLVLDMAQSTFTDSQVYRIQEVNNEKGRQLSLACLAIDKPLFWYGKPGQKVKTTGIFKVEPYREPRTQKIRYRKYLELVNIEPLESAEITVTSEDIARFKEIVKDPMFYQSLVESYAPHVYGLEDAKEICMMVLASCGIPRPLNGLLAGPPGGAKTLLIEYTVALSPNGHLATVANATKAGLTSSHDIDPDTQTRITKPGLFAWADGGLVGLTELQAIQAQDAKALNDALERKEVASARADGVQTLKARCAVLFDTNNYNGDWDYDMRLAFNLRFLEHNIMGFLSRMDLITVMPRVSDDSTHRNIAYSNFDTYRASEKATDLHLDDWEDSQTKIVHYGFKTLQKYFAYVNTLPLPELAAGLREKYADNFLQALRGNNDFLVDGRYNRTVALVAKIHARLLLKEAADEEDLAEAIRMVNKSKFVVVQQPGKEATDGNALLGLPPKDEVSRKENQIKQFWHAYRLACLDKDQTTDKGYATKEDIVAYLVINRWDEDKAAAYVDKMSREGKIYEPMGQGKYTRNSSII